MLMSVFFCVRKVLAYAKRQEYGRGYLLAERARRFHAAAGTVAVRRSAEHLIYTATYLIHLST